MVRDHDYWSAIDRHILEAYDMLLTEVEARVDILQICSKRFEKERVISGCSFLLHKFAFFVSITKVVILF